jgi:hypothetical protein
MNGAAPVTAPNGTFSFRRTLFATAFAVASGCSGDGQEPVRPDSVAVQDGNNQSGAVGAAAAQPLRVRVTGTDGRPYAGATVAWQVTSGDAQVAPPSSVTDAQGMAATSLTFGATPGDVAISATVQGLTPAAFSATSTSPCQSETPLAIGQTINASLTAVDCKDPENRPLDRYGFTLDQAGSVEIIQSSTALDALLRLNNSADQLIALNDDLSDTSLDAKLRLFLPAGEYLLMAGGTDGTELGDYSLATRATTDDITGCALFTTWVVPGVQVTQQLSNTDCTVSDSEDNLYYTDPIFVRLQQGGNITVTLTSTVVNAYVDIWLVTNTGFEPLAANDDEAPGSTNARLEFAPPVTGVYMLLPSSAVPIQTGEYTLTIQ